MAEVNVLMNIVLGTATQVFVYYHYKDIAFTKTQ